MFQLVPTCPDTRNLAYSASCATLVFSVETQKLSQHPPSGPDLRRWRRPIATFGACGAQSRGLRPACTAVHAALCRGTRPSLRKCTLCKCTLGLVALRIAAFLQVWFLGGRQVPWPCTYIPPPSALRGGAPDTYIPPASAGPNPPRSIPHTPKPHVHSHTDPPGRCQRQQPQHNQHRAPGHQQHQPEHTQPCRGHTHAPAARSCVTCAA